MECKYTHWPSLQNPSLQQRAAFFIWISAFQVECEICFCVVVQWHILKRVWLTIYSLYKSQPFPVYFFWDKVPREFVRAKHFVLFCPCLSSSSFTFSDPAVNFRHKQMFKPVFAVKMIINGWLCEGTEEGLLFTQYNRFNLLSSSSLFSP